MLGETDSGTAIKRLREYAASEETAPLFFTKEQAQSLVADLDWMVTKLATDGKLEVVSDISHSIIQIAISPKADGWPDILFALCSDGSIWRRPVTAAEPTLNRWTKIPTPYDEIQNDD